MKIAKGFAIFSIIALLFGSCFKEPQFSIIPEIVSLDKVYFQNSPSESDADTLTIVLTFKDGDGDLGLDPDDPKHINSPYNANNLYLVKDGKLISIETFSGNLTANGSVVKVLDPILIIPEGVTGKLVIDKTRNVDNNDTIQNINPNLPCVKYVGDTSVFIREKDKAIFDATYNVIDTIKTNTEDIYKIEGKFYYQPNPNYYNIEITFEVKENNFKAYEFGDCNPKIYSQRFPVLGTPKHPIEGTLKYNIISAGLLNDFGDKVIRLRIRIKDQAHHESNIVYSEEKSLEQFIE